MFSRRRFLESLAASAAFTGLSPRIWQSATAQLLPGINRKNLVNRHNPQLHKIDPFSPLTVGNGEFAFTADVTGLQTLGSAYEASMPLCTMSQWGWHSKPAPGHLRGKTLRLVEYDTHGRKVGYHTSSEGQEELYNWLRENPHRLHLGRLALCFGDEPAAEITAPDVSQIDQQLDLWRGILTSRFRLKGEAVMLTTAVHPQQDLLAVRIDSPLLKTARLSVKLVFPYGSSTMQAASWNENDKHQSQIVSRERKSVTLSRRLDQDTYSVRLQWSGDANFNTIADHHFVLTPTGSAALFEFCIAFSRRTTTVSLPSVAATFSSCESHWERFWNLGGAVDFANSKDQRAFELERRVVLSQYLTAIQCSGSLPPQETGLTVNSWYGKFHLEMHWWHAAHFALWNRLPLLEKSLGWYEAILPKAKELARSQGYVGARWPKMVGPEGDDSPSPIGPLLVWQQPHPIFYAELCYQTHPNVSTLRRYRDVVFESAEFMASYAFRDSATDKYWLGPPLIPAQENHPPRETWNPTFELAYWSYGLQVAQRWRERLGMSRSSRWDQIISSLAPLPIQDGVYLAHANCPQTYTERNRDHPSMLAAYGFLPGDGVDRETMRRTLRRTMKDWQWNNTWGWDYPMVAMTAARLGETRVAVDALLMETEKNRYLPNGHNWQRDNLPCYLPGNGGLLYAIAMMAGGWRKAKRANAPGFPDDGTWSIRAEGFRSRELVA